NRRLAAPWAHEIVGRSPAVETLLREIQLAGPTAARVLIQGENGTGKELVARAARGQPAGDAALRGGELLGDPRGADRIGALRSRARRLHRGDAVASRPLRGVAPGNALPGRDRRHEPE